MKNIPLRTKDSYRQNLNFKLESFIKRIRWKAFFFDKNSKSNEQSSDNFNFKSIKTQPKNKNLIFKTRYLKLEEEIEQHSQHQSFITLKDHKVNFQNNPKCRSINRAKSEIGIVSRHYIEKINKNIRRGINENEWRNTQEIISWFK